MYRCDALRHDLVVAMLSLQLDLILEIFSNLNDSVNIPSSPTSVHSFYFVLSSSVKNISYLNNGVGYKKM